MSYLETANSSASDNWPTPPWIVAQAAAEFGPFNLDPAADAENAKAPAFYTAEDDGLAQPWHGRVWMNPPYGRTIGQWMRKARGEVVAGRAQLAVCLIPVRVDAKWWQQCVTRAEPKPLVRFWPKRLRYVKDWDAPFASATIVFGHESTGKRHGTIARECAQCGSIFWPAQANRVTCSEACKKARQRVSRTAPQEMSPAQAPVRDTAAASVGDTHAFLKLVRDDPGRAQMIARDYLATPRHQQMELEVS